MVQNSKGSKEQLMKKTHPCLLFLSPGQPVPLPKGSH